MGLQVVGDSCRTEWTFVQKQCSFVSPWPLEACRGLALASRQKCLHSGFVPQPSYNTGAIGRHRREDRGGVGHSVDGGMMESLSLTPAATVFLSYFCFLLACGMDRLLTQQQFPHVCGNLKFAMAS